MIRILTENKTYHTIKLLPNFLNTCSSFFPIVRPRIIVQRFSICRRVIPSFLEVKINEEIENKTKRVSYGTSEYCDTRSWEIHFIVGSAVVGTQVGQVLLWLHAFIKKN